MVNLTLINWNLQRKWFFSNNFCRTQTEPRTTRRTHGLRINNAVVSRWKWGSSGINDNFWHSFFSRYLKISRAVVCLDTDALGLRLRCVVAARLECVKWSAKEKKIWEKFRCLRAGYYTVTKGWFITHWVVTSVLSLIWNYWWYTENEHSFIACQFVW
jgi:hypothetical protein